MDETKSGIGWWGIVIVFILLFAVFGNGNLFGGRCIGNGFGYGFDGYAGGMGYGFQNFKATCDAEKAEIINSATTQYKVIEQAQATRETVQSTAAATQAKIDFYGYQDLRDKLAESQRENLVLQNKLFVKEQLAPITAQLSSIQCNMLRRPDVTGIGAVCPNAGIINGLGLNTLNGYGSCGCGCNGASVA